MLTPDEKLLLTTLARCVKLIGWHVRELRGDSEAKLEIQQALDNLDVILRVLNKESAGR